MRSDTNEFVFIRKRKRLRTLDPQAAETATPDRVSNLHSGLIPEIAVLSEPPIPSPAFPDNPSPLNPKALSENIVTVDNFLRRSSQTATRIRQVSGNTSLRKPRAYTRHLPAERRTARARKPAKIPKQPPERSRIAKALFRAAILTDGDPLDSLVDDAGVIHARRPLKFVPFNKFSSPRRPGQTDSIEPSRLVHGDGPAHIRRHGRIPDHKQHHQPRAPLYMVPLQEAEVAYSIMFP